MVSLWLRSRSDSVRVAKRVNDWLEGQVSLTSLQSAAHAPAIVEATKTVSLLHALESGSRRIDELSRSFEALGVGDVEKLPEVLHEEFNKIGTLQCFLVLTILTYTD